MNFTLIIIQKFKFDEDEDKQQKVYNNFDES